MSSTLVEARPPVSVPEEVSPELALVCPDTRRHARALLPDRDPYAFLRGAPREEKVESLVPEPAQLPALRLVQPATQVALPIVLRRPEAEPPAALVPSAPATEAAERPPAPVSASIPQLLETSRIAPQPAPAAAVPEPEPDEEQQTFLAYAARELLMLGVAAATTVAGLTAAMTIIDVFFVR